MIEAFSTSSLLLVLVGAAGLSGCLPGTEGGGDSGTSGTSSSGSDAPGSSSSGASGTTEGATSSSGTTGAADPSETGSTGGETGDATEPTPPPVVSACHAPTSTTSASFDAAVEQRFDAVSMAYNGSSVALVYAESTSDVTWSVWMQQLNQAGEVLGDRILLGESAFPKPRGVGPLPRPWLTVAAIDDRFVTCWTGASGGDSIACSSVDDDGVLTPGLIAQGRDPGLATGPAGVGLVYTEGNAFVSRRLDDRGQALDEPYEVFSVGGTVLEVRPWLAASSVTYVAGADVILPRFDADFREIEGSAATGWTSLPVALAGSGDVIAAAWGSLEGVQVRVSQSDSEDFGEATRIDGLEGNTSAATTVIARADGSFAALWSVDASFQYAALSLDGMPLSSPLEVLQAVRSPSSISLIATQQGFLAAGVLGYDGEELVVIELDCP